MLEEKETLLWVDVEEKVAIVNIQKKYKPVLISSYVSCV